MRASLADTHPGATKRRALLFAALLLTALCVLGGSLEASAPAKTPQEKLEATQNKLEGVRANQSALAETIAEQNAAIDSMIGEVSALRQKLAAVRGELVAKEAELEAATTALEEEREHLEEVREKLQPSARGPAPAAGRDLRDGIAERRQRDPRIRRLVADGGPGRIPEPYPEL